MEIANCIPNAQARFFALMIARCRYATGLLFWPPTTVFCVQRRRLIPFAWFSLFFSSFSVVVFVLCNCFFRSQSEVARCSLCFPALTPHSAILTSFLLFSHADSLCWMFLFGSLARVLDLHGPLDIRACDDFFMPNTYCMLHFPAVVLARNRLPRYSLAASKDRTCSTPNTEL